jgi:hypothetical protein
VSYRGIGVLAYYIGSGVVKGRRVVYVHNRYRRSTRLQEYRGSTVIHGYRSIIGVHGYRCSTGVQEWYRCITVVQE